LGGINYEQQVGRRSEKGGPILGTTLSDQPDPSGQPVATLVIRKKQELR